MRAPLTAPTRLGITAALLVATSGCSALGGGGGAPSSSAPPPSASEPSAPAGDPSPSSEDRATKTSGGIGVEAPDLGDTIASQTVPSGSVAGDEVDVGLLSLEVEGDTMLLLATLTPRLESESDAEKISLFTTLGDHGFRPALVDTANLKRYEPLGGATSTSADLGTSAPNGAPMLVWAYFAAPEDDISTIDVRIYDGWPAFTDVPITR